jgi:hypothetical protein
MKTKNIILIVLLAVLISIAVQAFAQTLPVDSRKKEMQFNKTFACLNYAPAADTTWRRITLPSGCTEVIITAATGAIGIRPDSLYTNNYFVNLPVGVPQKLPAIKHTMFFIRRTAAATASTASILFLKM